MSTSTALYFGSFDPVHLGHLSIANHVMSNNLCHEVWFVVSPQNPLKRNIDFALPQHRKTMLELATVSNQFMHVCDIEFEMPKPSYTINTLKKLYQLYPEKTFSIICGMDNLLIFKQWKQWEDIINKHTLLIYPRGQVEPDYELCIRHNNVHILQNATLLNFSSSTIREKVRNGINLKNFVPSAVADYIKEHKLYL